jgi:cytochrome c
MRGAALAPVVLAAALSACANAPAPGPADEAAVRGRDEAVSQCAGCHNIGLKGASTYPAAPPFRTLRGRWSGESLQVRLGRLPLHRGYDMPMHPLTAREADDIAAFITALRAGKPPPGPPLRANICNPMWWC